MADHVLALVLGGGNALGAFQAGGYEALHDRGLEPDRVIGVSIGAVNGAILCGNAPNERMAKLTAFWSPASASASEMIGRMPTTDESRRTAAVAAVMLSGLPHAFSPRQILGPWWNPFGNSEPSSLYDTTPLGRTLERLIDFDRLNAGQPQFALTAVDLESGEEVVFDTTHSSITANHVRASASLIPAFPSVEIEGRWLGDGGLSSNLPLDVILDAPTDRPMLCIALDLLPLRGLRPEKLGDAIIRAQDLTFASQSRRTIAALQAIFDERARQSEGAPSVTLLHLLHSGQDYEVSGKAFDFSPESVRRRWSAGKRLVASALAQVEAGDVQMGRPGLTVYQSQGNDGSPLREVRLGLAPVRG